jgi:iron complex outermembrane receptor protein
MANTKSLLWQNVFNIQHDWIHSIGLKYDRADANFFQDVKSRADIFYSISKGIKMKKTSIGFTLIQHLVAQKLAPIQGEINLRGDRYFIDIIKNYNLPSFNDLYWPVGGNENLKTENSLQFSGGYTLDIGNHLTSKINLYSSHISNFIQWLPTVNNFWSPINVQKIWSRGVEIEMNYEKKFHLIKFLNSTKYTITKSTYEDDAKNKGSQLIYVPLHKLTNNLSIIKKHFAFDINTTLLGKRYETTDNFTHLNPALLFNASISYQSNIKNIKPKLKLSVQNIFNEHYEFVRLFPQPLRRISLEIKFIF